MKITNCTNQMLQKGFYKCTHTLPPPPTLPPYPSPPADFPHLRLPNSVSEYPSFLHPGPCPLAIFQGPSAATWAISYSRNGASSSLRHPGAAAGRRRPDSSAALFAQLTCGRSWRLCLYIVYSDLLHFILNVD